MTEKTVTKKTVEKTVGKGVASVRATSQAAKLEAGKAEKKKIVKKKKKTVKKVGKKAPVLVDKRAKPKSRQFYMDLLCAAISTTEKGIHRLCKELQAIEPDFPSTYSILQWLQQDEVLATQYAHAKEKQADVLADQIIEISDDASMDEVFTGEGKRMMNAEFVARSKLRVDARKWVASKLKPKKYGDKVTNEITGPNGDPLSLLLQQIDGGTKDMVRP